MEYIYHSGCARNVSESVPNYGVFCLSFVTDTFIISLPHRERDKKIQAAPLTYIIYIFVTYQNLYKG